MDATLSRRLAAAFNTPYFQFAVTQVPNLKERVTNEAVKANIFLNLSQDTRELIEKSEASIQVAQKLFPSIQPLFLSNEQKLKIVVEVEDDYKQG
ncbi:MAG: hypothetical protein KME30_29140 [Iphinoe sp. HA4291-MV1]|jgi:UDP-N-acetylmuramyl tripeptide synthase|nr:hypothetical protein [Iphinoe sp. HA4291-MV1]